MAEEPLGDLHARDDADPVGLAPHVDVVGVDGDGDGDGDDEPFDVNGEAAGGDEESCCTGGFVAAVADVGLLVAVHHEGAAADPGLCAGVVLCVGGEDAAGTDDQVVDVGSSVATGMAWMNRQRGSFLATLPSWAATFSSPSAPMRSPNRRLPCLEGVSLTEASRNGECLWPFGFTSATPRPRLVALVFKPHACRHHLGRYELCRPGTWRLHSP